MTSLQLPISESAYHLAPDQIVQFWDDGFLVIEDVFSPAQIAELRAACDEAQEDRAWKTATTTVHSLGLTQRHPRFLEMARDPRIVDRLRSLIGPDIQIQHSKLAAKPLAKGEGPFGWHQDFSYFPHTNTDLVAVMVMLDDSTPDNGCMSMVKASHKMGLLNHTNEQGYFTGGCLDPIWEREPHRVVPVTPRAGGISMHHCLTLHGSPANLSGKPRRGLVIQYRAADAFQMADTIFGDTGLVVSGQPSAFARCTVGTVRLPRFPGRPQAGFGSAWNQRGEFANTQNEQLLK